MKTSKHRGFIELIILIIIALVILAYLKVDLRSIVESDGFQKNFDYVKMSWSDYIWPHILLAWHYLVDQIIKPLTGNSA